MIFLIVGSTEKAASRAATHAALASMLLQAAEQVAAERNSLEGGSLKVGVEGGVGMASFLSTLFCIHHQGRCCCGNGPKL